jgi:hypothetical protein
VPCQRRLDVEVRAVARGGRRLRPRADDAVRNGNTDARRAPLEIEPGRRAKGPWAAAVRELVDGEVPAREDRIVDVPVAHLGTEHGDTTQCGAHAAARREHAVQIGKCRNQENAGTRDAEGRRGPHEPTRCARRHERNEPDRERSESHPFEREQLVARARVPRDEVPRPVHEQPGHDRGPRGQRALPTAGLDRRARLARRIAGARIARRDGEREHRPHEHGTTGSRDGPGHHRRTFVSSEYRDARRQPVIADGPGESVPEA